MQFISALYQVKLTSNQVYSFMLKILLSLSINHLGSQLTVSVTRHDSVTRYFEALILADKYKNRQTLSCTDMKS